MDADKKQEPNAHPLSSEDSKDDGSVSEPKAELESSINKPVSPKPVSSDAWDDQNKQDSLNVPVSPTTKLDDACEDDDAQDSFDGDDMSDDDELSPKTKEQLDREVAEFAQRLRTPWSEWKAKFLSGHVGDVPGGGSKGVSEDNQDAR